MHLFEGSGAHSECTVPTVSEAIISGVVFANVAGPTQGTEFLKVGVGLGFASSQGHTMHSPKGSSADRLGLASLLQSREKWFCPSQHREIPKSNYLTPKVGSMAMNLELLELVLGTRTPVLNNSSGV